MYSYLHIEIGRLNACEKDLCKTQCAGAEQSDYNQDQIRFTISQLSALVSSVCLHIVHFLQNYIFRPQTCFDLPNVQQNTKNSSFWKTFGILKGSKGYQIEISFNQNLTVMTFVKTLKQPGFCWPQILHKSLVA